jgi:hypothetical protein
MEKMLLLKREVRENYISFPKLTIVCPKTAQRRLSPKWYVVQKIVHTKVFLSE